MNSRGYFIFNGERSSDYGVYISGNQTFGAAVRDFSAITVPGRDGVLLIDNGRFEPIEHPYEAFIINDFKQNVAAFRNYLMSIHGPARLTDSYHPDEYYRAYYNAGLEPDVNRILRAGSFDITFTRDPRRFLLSGEEVTTISGSGTIENPTLFPARPLIRAYGTGTVGIGSETITINYADGYTDIDCEIRDAYKGPVNCNQYIELTGDDFPTLQPGNTGIVLSGVTSVEITPRWYIL